MMATRNAQASGSGLWHLCIVIPRRKWAWAWIVSTLLAAGALPARAQDEAPVTSTSDGAATNAAGTNAMAATAEPAAEKSSAAPASNESGYSAFKMIADRNIFNGNRSGQVIRSTRSSTQQRSVRVDSFALVGTMVSEKGPMAFFDGTESSYRKAVRTGDSIAGFKIHEILHAGVRLAAGTNTVDLKVGSGMRREDEGLWKPASSGLSFASGSASSRSSTSYSSRSDGGSSRDRSSSSRNESRSENSGSDAASSADVDEVLKRLMEKREKE